MIFISLVRWTKKPTKEGVARSSKFFEQMAKEGVKVLGQYWTLGRYDTVIIMEAKDEKTIMKAALQLPESFLTETLVAVTREEAIKLLEQ